MSSINKLSIAVGISAFNEQESIGKVVSSVLSQSYKDIILKKVYVVSDGSTDSTAKIVKSIKDKRVCLIESKKREGLTKSLNKIISRIDEDIFVKIDADVTLLSSNTINNLCQPFIKDKKLGYACGRLIPRPPKTIIEKILNYNRAVWDKIKYAANDGKSVMSCAGGLFALSKNNLKKFKFPDDVWADIGYLYFWTKKNQKGYLSVANAIVSFRPPMNLNDYKLQKDRYDKEGQVLTKYFDKDLIKKEYFIDKNKTQVTKLYQKPNHVFWFCNSKLNSQNKEKNKRSLRKWLGKNIKHKTRLT